MKEYNFFSVDIGATSGRTILGRFVDGKVTIEELTRFPNKILRLGDKYHWNVYSLFEAIKEGLAKTAQAGIKIDSIGIDTWGVDFVYLNEDGEIISLPRSYRDPYTNGAPEEFFKIMSHREVYDLTGIQIMNFNSLFQLYAAKREGSFALKQAKEILFMPDALAYLLSGEKFCEYTIASTSQLLNPSTGQVEPKLFEALEVPPLLAKMVQPGTVVGKLRKEIAEECGVDEIPVIAVAGHDTGSAVVSVPAVDKNFAYLSSGTWSLMGIEVDKPIVNEESYAHNYTNEGGVDGTIRFLKNITGMWLLERCRGEWSAAGRDYEYPQIMEMAREAQDFEAYIDPDDTSFANPDNMVGAIADYCTKTGQKTPSSDSEFVITIFRSLALKYRCVLEILQGFSTFPIERLHVIGGGAKNALLNQMTSNAIGMEVAAGPGEATAIGNIMLQARGVGALKSLAEIRQVVEVSFPADRYQPQESEKWSGYYKKFKEIIK